MPTTLLREVRRLLTPAEPPERMRNMKPLATCGLIKMEEGKPMGAGHLSLRYYHGRIDKDRLEDLANLVRGFKAPEGFQLTVYEVNPPSLLVRPFARERLVRIAIQYRTKTVTSKALSDAWHGRSETT